MDFWVKHTQMWLNNTFGNNKDWVRLQENGLTGTNTIKGLIRAFQINNSISPVTGEVGPLTRKMFKSLPKITKMNPDDEPNINVFIIQGALFCKGYNAGGLTGIYYNSGVAAIKKLQSNAAIEETGVIGWKEWSALLSMNWFTLVKGGNPIVRTIQRQLNSEFSNEIGVGPCDGVVSRHTALSLIGALQAAEGIKVVEDLNEVNFGEETTKRCPTLKIDQNSEHYRKFNRILQYGLYFNGFDPMGFDGIFNAKTQMCVAQFQKKYALLGINLVVEGIANPPTIKSLLTSKGDTSRRAYACDCSTVLNEAQAKDLKKAGFTHVGRYLTGTVGVGANERSKALTLKEINIIKNSGLSLFLIYQDGGYYPEYFHEDLQGFSDAKIAIITAQNLGIPKGSTIYFAVDFDCYGYEVDNYIIPYFQRIKLAFNGPLNSKRYKIGIYAARNVCSRISKLRLASTSFVADMSTGFSGNLGFPIPDNWAFDQFFEFLFKSSPSFDLDKDAYSGLDKGCSTFDPVKDKTDEEIAKEKLLTQIEMARTQYVYSVVRPIGYLDTVMSLDLNFESEKINLGYHYSPVCDVKSDLIISAKRQIIGSDETPTIPIEINQDGEVSATFQSDVAEITRDITDLDQVKKIEDFFYGLALSVKSGDITSQIEVIGPQQMKLTVEVSNEDIPVSGNIKTELSVTLEFIISLKNPNQEFDLNAAVETLFVVAFGSAVITAILYLGGAATIPVILDFISRYKIITVLA